jgi:hypothetical protein
LISRLSRSMKFEDLIFRNIGAGFGYWNKKRLQRE